LFVQQKPLTKEVSMTNEPRKQIKFQFKQVRLLRSMCVLLEGKISAKHERNNICPYKYQTIESIIIFRKLHSYQVMGNLRMLKARHDHLLYL